MSEQPGAELLARLHQPLIGVVDVDGSEETVRYFCAVQEADDALTTEAPDDERSLAGIWSHLSWDDMVRELDRIRHDSVPTPPIEP